MSRLKHKKLRNAIIETCLKMNAVGINQGTSGNVSARVEEGLLVTPTGMPYDSIEPEDICTIHWDGTYDGERMPTSEWRFHYDIMRSRPDCGAIVHTHAMHCVVLACLHQEIPSFHYMVAVAGGYDIRVAPYARYGTQALSDNAIQALQDRKACLLANHGMIAIGKDLGQALGIAIEVETLATQYVRVLQTGKPKLLTKAQMDEVLVRIANYGKQAHEIEDGTPPAMEPPPRRMS